MSASRQVALVTCSWLPDLDADDRALIGGLQAGGLAARPVIWTDPTVDWSAFALALVRNPWDYSQRHDEWLAWVDRVAAATSVWNPPSVLRWNSHKSYLRRLADAGAPVIPTVWTTAGETLDAAALSTVMERRGWPELVVKPAVSGGARNTYRVTAASLGAQAAAITALAAARDLMIQPYYPSVEGYGERSLIFIDGALTHAIRKHPQLVPGHLEGHEPLVSPTDDEVAAARAVLAQVSEPLLYARVDLARDAADRPVLMELEIVEPSLFFWDAPHAVAALCQAVARRLT